MKKLIVLPGCVTLLSVLLFACTTKPTTEQPSATTVQVTTEAMSSQITPDHQQEVSATQGDTALAEPVIEERDWSACFQGLNGGAVIYLPDENRYLVYNEELVNTRRSPCSTFKIISSLIGIEQGVITDQQSERTWSGETFWNENWNRDIGFADAFSTSCVWYFRELIDQLGPEVIEQELKQLQYGNCDISDWQGKQNNNNHNRALTGFWIESSLLISPMEQVQVLERIFGSNSSYSSATLELLKDVMTVTDSQGYELPLYGKTGTGKSNGVTVDAWFTGFTQLGDQTMYLCVYLGETKGVEVTSVNAREIGLEILMQETAAQGEEQPYSFSPARDSEEALQAFVQASRGGDLGTILGTFAVKEYVDNYDHQAKSAQLIKKPTITERQMEATEDILGFFVGLQMKRQDLERPEQLMATLENISPLSLLESGNYEDLQIIRIDLPEVDPQLHLERIAKETMSMELYGADGWDYRTALLSYQGETYYCGFEFVIYDGVYTIKNLSCPMISIPWQIVTLPMTEQEYLSVIEG